MRGITQLYAELMLLALVLSIGAVISHIAIGISTALRNIKLPPKISAYRVGDTVIIANWGEDCYRVRVICVDNGVYDELEVWPGTYLYNTTCADVVIVYYEYTIRPQRIR
ncbi:MAG: hypothetical protein QW780_05820 [Sulfolobales archaeon]